MTFLISEQPQYFQYLEVYYQNRRIRPCFQLTCFSRFFFSLLVKNTKWIRLTPSPPKRGLVDVSKRRKSKYVDGPWENKKETSGNNNISYSKEKIAINYSVPVLPGISPRRMKTLARRILALYAGIFQSIFAVLCPPNFRRACIISLFAAMNIYRTELVSGTKTFANLLAKRPLLAVIYFSSRSW